MLNLGGVFHVYFMGTWRTTVEIVKKSCEIPFFKNPIFLRDFRSESPLIICSLSSGMLELQDDGVLGPAKEHPTAFRVELPQYSQQLRLLDGGVFR